MRIYIPLTASDLTKDSLVSQGVHAVTPDLKRAVQEDEEGYEYIAMLSAADDSLRLLGGRDGEVRRRIVAVANVDNSALELPAKGEDVLPTFMYLIAPVAWKKVESIHVDEPGSEGLVEKAIADDEDAFLATGDIDLMWYDVVERKALASELNG